MRSQLSSERGDVTVRVALKAEDPIDRLRALKTADDEVERWLLEAVSEARKAGRSWESIGDALGVSRQAAWKLYNAELGSAIARVRKHTGLSEKEATALTREELRSARSRRHR